MMLTVAHVGGRAFGGGLFFLGPLLFLLLVGLVVFMILRRTGQGFWLPQPSAGLTVLEERYASGGIEREEYLAKRADLAPRSQKPDKKR